MILSTPAHLFTPGYLPPQNITDGLALVFYEKKLLLLQDGPAQRLPYCSELPAAWHALPGTYFGHYGSESCFYYHTAARPALSANWVAADLRSITQRTGDAGLFTLAGTAHHLLHWAQSNRFCGHCGHEMGDKQDERAKICPACGNIVYPRISPATITAILRGDEILLAHNRNFNPGMHSLIAGFVEPGETLEQCVAREIGEEIGIRVNHIRYFSSQPWPFPDSLMTAFLADYDSGEIAVDGAEIVSAGWYRADALPAVPGADSIAGKMIRWYCNQQAHGGAAGV